jgi:hypothetical protein
MHDLCELKFGTAIGLARHTADLTQRLCEYECRAPPLQREVKAEARLCDAYCFPALLMLLRKIRPGPRWPGNDAHCCHLCTGGRRRAAMGSSSERTGCCAPKSGLRRSQTLKPRFDASESLRSNDRA